MSRVTRSATRRVVSLSSEATTPHSFESPALSSRPDSIAEEPDTPLTSDVEEVVVKKRSVSMQTRTTRNNKRTAESDSEDIDNIKQESVSAARPPKRRAVSNRAYVSVPQPKKNQGGSKVRISIV